MGLRGSAPLLQEGAENNERGADAYHAYHGEGGPLNVANPRYVNPLSYAFVEAGSELGLPSNDDFNGEEQDGVGLYQPTQKGVSATAPPTPT